MRYVIFFGILLAVALIGVALYRNWVSVETTARDRPDDSSTTVHIKVDKAKMREDLKEAREEARDLAKRTTEGARDIKKKAEALVGGTTLQGQVMDVNAEAKQLVLKSGETTHMLRVAQDAEVKRGDDKIDLAAIRVGEQATVKVKEQDGVKVAQSVMVSPKG